MTNENTPSPSRLGARLLTVDQVAETLQISRWNVYRLIWANDLNSVRSDGVDAFVVRHSMPISLG